MKIVVRANTSYWRWGWLGPYATWNTGLIYPWRLALGPVQFRGETGNLDKFNLVNKRRKQAVARAEDAVRLLDAVNKCAADNLRGAIRDTKRLWEIA